MLSLLVCRTHFTIPLWRGEPCFCYPFQVRCFLISGLLLCSAVGWAQAVPSRSLLGEMTLSEQKGMPASVHTNFAIGNGLFVDADKVIVARHTVLTPDGEIAGDIGVGSSRPPLNNVMESRSVAIAQDPAHDLALLQLLDDELPAANTKAAAVSPAQCVSITPARHTHVRLRHTRKKPPSRVGNGTGPRLLKTSASTPVGLRIVWDGPLPRSR